MLAFRDVIEHPNNTAIHHRRPVQFNDPATWQPVLYGHGLGVTDFLDTFLNKAFRVARAKIAAFCPKAKDFDDRFSFNDHIGRHLVHLQEIGAHNLDIEILVIHEKAAGHVLKRGAQADFARLQCLLGLPALGNILDGRAHQDRFSVLVEDRYFGDFYIPYATVRPGPDFFPGDRSLFGPNLFLMSNLSFQILLGAAHDTIRCLAEHVGFGCFPPFQEFVIGEHHLAPLILETDSYGQGVGNQAKQVFIVAKGF